MCDPGMVSSDAEVRILYEGGRKSDREGFGRAMAMLRVLCWFRSSRPSLYNDRKTVLNKWRTSVVVYTEYGGIKGVS